MSEEICTTSLLQEFKEYSQNLSPQKLSNIKTALYRYYGAGLSGHRTKKVRFDERAINKAEKLLDAVIIDDTFNLENHLDIFDKGRETLGISITKARASKSYLKTFLEYIDNKFPKLIVNNTSINTNKQVPLKRKVIDKSYINNSLKDKKRKRNETLTLVGEVDLFINRLEEKYPLKSQVELKEIIQKNIERLNREKQSYQDYWVEQGVRQVTINANISSLNRWLGWYYKYVNTNQTIEELSLLKLIPVINTKVYSVLDTKERYIKEGELQDIAKLESKHLSKQIDTFFKTYKVKGKSSIIGYMSSLINLAKFLYKDITDIDDADNYEDIVIIRHLRVKRKQLENKINNISKTPLLLTWEEVLQVVESYRLDAISNTVFKSKGDRAKSRRIKAIHLQRFLILAMFTVIPPDRQRTVRELTFGTTLKYGKQDITGFFIPIDIATDIVNEGSYFISLKPEDYKTGETYGDFIIPIPNKEYEDGTKFYSYLNEWLFNYREELALKTTETVFVGNRLGQSMKQVDLGDQIGTLFLRRTGVRVSPHKLRNIFITYINNKDITDTQRKSIAYAMKHDLTTAEKFYNNQTSLERLKPAIDYLNSTQTTKP